MCASERRAFGIVLGVVTLVTAWHVVVGATLGLGDAEALYFCQKLCPTQVTR